MEQAFAPPASPSVDARAAARLTTGIAAGALPLLALLAFPGLVFRLPGAGYVALHAVIEVGVVVVCFGTFAVEWYAAGAGAGTARGRFVGAAFLGVGLLETVHLLAFPGMTAFVTAGSTGRGIWYWLAARLWTVGALVVAAFVPTTSGRPLLRRGPLLAITLALVAAVVLVELRSPAASSLFFVEGSGLTALKRNVEYLVMALAVVGAAANLARWRRTGEPAVLEIGAALGLTVLSEICFTRYASAYDAFNLLGHVYLAVAFWLMFDALFVASLLRPYGALRDAARELSEKNAELERLRRHIEGELAVTIARLRETQELREDLLRAVTHDLRTPLQVVLLQGERLARLAAERGAETEARGAIAIVNGSRRIEAMLRDLAESARLERGLELHRAPLSLSRVVSELLAGSSAALDVSRVQVDIPARLPPVDADASRLERVLANLVGTALKYSHDRVVVDARPADGQVQVSVADRGPGIAGGDLPRIFDRYYRGQRHEGEGLGLGLYIVRKLVEAHGGRIWAESRPGEGSIFTFTLPVAPA